MSRYVQSTDEDRAEMLSAIGVRSIVDLFSGIPEAARLERKLDVPERLTEPELVAAMGALARKNAAADPRVASFLGAGMYDHWIPSVVDAIAGRGEFSTSYTQYQPEASQGYLQVLFEYQTMICELTGMDVSNASLYDGASALAEAGILAHRATGKKTVVVSEGVHPEWRRTLETYFARTELSVETLPVGKDGRTDPRRVGGVRVDDTAAVVFQSPNFFGVIEDAPRLIDETKARDALAVVAADPISLAVLEAPGRQGADVCVFEGQPLGVPVSFGGPALGGLAAKEALMRKMPGRIVGRTKDHAGRTGYVLTLQTREQHIRREKATSNICTNQALMALRAAIYLAFMGPQGLREAALLSAKRAHDLAEGLSSLHGFALVHDAPFLREFLLRTPIPASAFLERMRAHDVLAGVALDRFERGRTHEVLVAATDRNTEEQVARYVAAARKVVGQ